MKNKNSTLVAVLMLSLVACKKTNDVQPVQESVTTTESSNLAGSDCKTAEWLTGNAKAYPSTKKTTYNGCSDEFGRSTYGTRYITFNKDPQVAQVGDLVKFSTLDSNFYYYYSSGKSTKVSGSTKWYLTETSNSYGLKTYKVKGGKTVVDEQGNIQNVVNINIIKYTNATTNAYEKTGNGSGTGVAPYSNSFESVISKNKPLVSLGDGFRYPVKGVVTVKLIQNGETHVQVLDYGNGEKDNLGTLSIDGGPATQVTLPLESWGEYIGE